MKLFSKMAKGLLAAVLAVGLVPAPAFGDFPAAQASGLAAARAGGIVTASEGDEVSSLPGLGTEESPYQIGGYLELGFFAECANAGRAASSSEGAVACTGAFAQLTKDVSIPASEALSPIGSADFPFSGTFDGAGHAITLNYRTATTYSVFGKLDGATVKGLTVRGATTTTSGTSGGRTVAGGTFAGVIDGRATFSDCANEAIVVGKAGPVGGFAAQVSGEAAFVGCVNRGSVAGRADDGSAVAGVGGFVGACSAAAGSGTASSCTFDGCVNRGPVASAAGTGAGGLVGIAEGAGALELLNVGNEGAVSAVGDAGGLLGAASDVGELSLAGGYGTGSVTVSGTAVAGGLFGRVQPSGSGGVTTRVAAEGAYAACDLSGAANAALGGVAGQLTCDAGSSFDGVYYSSDRAPAGIGADPAAAGWESRLAPRTDDAMRRAAFVDELGGAFMADAGENSGFPVLAAAKADLSGFFVYFTQQKEKDDPTSLELPWTGRALSPAVTVVRSADDPGIVARSSDEADALDALVEGEDYVVAYSGNVDAGTATAEVLGVGAFCGRASASFTIKSAGDVGDCAVEPVADQVFAGTAVTPAITLEGTKSGAAYTLVEGKDYTVSYASNRKPGTGLAFVRGMGAWTGSRTVAFRIWKPFVTVRYYNTKGAVAVEKHYTQAEFEALAKPGAEPVSALYYAGTAWKVSTAKSYVTLAGLLADAGVPWRSGLAAGWAASDNPEKASVYSYDDLRNRYFYPYCAANVFDSTDAVRVPPVLAIEEKSSLVGENYTATARQAEEYNVDNADAGNEPRIITGITAREGESKAARGMRLITNVQVITVRAVNPMTARPASATQALGYNASKDQEIAASKAFTVKNAKGKVTYSKVSGNEGITVSPAGKVTVAKKLALGSYPVSVQVSAAGTAGYAPASATVKFTVKVGKGTNPMTVAAKKPAAVAAGGSIAASKAFTVKGAAGAVSYIKSGGNAKITVSKSGKIAVRKGLKAGSYAVKVQVKAAGNGSYKPSTKSVTVTVRVK